MASYLTDDIDLTDGDATWQLRVIAFAILEPVSAPNPAVGQNPALCC